MFNSIFENGLTTSSFFVAMAVSLVCGVVFASLCSVKSTSTKSFFVATALLPMVVAMVICLVNGSIGTGIAIAGAFSLVRFRSAPGSAKEITMIFVSMAGGLAFGIGYLAYGAIFMVFCGGIFVLLNSIGIWERKTSSCERVLKITIPESLDYASAFDDIFEKYTTKHELLRTKTTNFGSMFRLSYVVMLKDISQEKQFIDELRTRNANLEISLNHASDNIEEQL